MVLIFQVTRCVCWRGVVGLLLLLGCLTGCGRSSKSVVIARDVVPEDVAKRAMELYDTNANGNIDGEELKKSPALTSVLPRLDSNKDKSVSADEIAARIREYQSQSDLLPISLQLERARRPLADAEVVFQMAPFFGENLPTFTGKSDASGNVTLTTEDADLPGLPIGPYDVRVSGPVSAELGCEVAEDGPDGGRIVLTL